MKDQKRIIFLTGATGLVGSHLLNILLQNGHYVYVLARGKGNKRAHQRVLEDLFFWNENITAADLKNLVVLEGDITCPNLGIKSIKQINELIKNIEIIYHSAALTKFRAPSKLINKINVDGTKNVLDLALLCKRKGKLIKVNHVSTTYVAGDLGDTYFNESMLKLGQNFHNVYEKSKYNAEIIITKYLRKGLDISIFRPSAIMGEYKEGKTIDFRLFYEPLHFFCQKIYDEFPANVHTYENLINIDTVTKGLYILGDKKGSDVYHLASIDYTNIGFFMELASKFFGFKIPKLIPVEEFPFSRWTPSQKLLAEPFIPYFNYKTKFLSEKTNSILFREGLILPKIDENNFIKIFDYCVRRGFLKPHKPKLQIIK